MKRLSLVFILVFVLAVEGVAINLLPNALQTSEYHFTPHWILLILILVTIFYDSEVTFIAIIYGAIFGLIIDIVYTDVLGVYMFTLAFTLYITKLFTRLLQTNFLMTIIITLLSLIIIEVTLYSIYSFIQVISVNMQYFVTYRLVPTILANIVFTLIIYYPMKKLLLWIKTEN